MAIFEVTVKFQRNGQQKSFPFLVMAEGETSAVAEAESRARDTGSEIIGKSICRSYRRAVATS